MIKLYSGTPGAGKSLHVASNIFYKLRAKKPVIANFEVNVHRIKAKKLGEFTYLDNIRMTPQTLIQYAMNYWNGKKIKEDTLLLVIDESQLLFNSRDWSRNGRNDWLSFFSQHRKYGYEIILIAQFDRMLDRQIRSLVEYEYMHRKVNNFGIGGTILGILAMGKLFVAIKVWYPMHEKVGSEFYKARKKYYSLYDTYGTFKMSAEDGGKGVPADSVILNELINNTTL
jgi:zona occludens toxin (predicted ATPase)